MKLLSQRLIKFKLLKSIKHCLYFRACNKPVNIDNEYRYSLCSNPLWKHLHAIIITWLKICHDIALTVTFEVF